MRIERRWEVLVEALTSAASALKPGQRIDITGFNPEDPDSWVEVLLRVQATSIEFLTGSQLPLYELWIHDRDNSVSDEAILPIETTSLASQELVLLTSVELQHLPAEIGNALTRLEGKGLAKPNWFYDLTAPLSAQERLRLTPGLELEGETMIRQRDQGHYPAHRFRRETYGFTG